MRVFACACGAYACARAYARGDYCSVALMICG